MLVVGPLKNLVQLLPFLLVVLLTGRSGDLNQIWFAIGGAAVVVLAGVLRWRTTRYRITDERVELHTGWLRRERRSVPRDRIRTVDLTASPLHRVFGLSVVQVGSATGGASALDRSARMDLDAVSKAEAERLRRELLDRTSVAASPVERPAVEIARLDWSWLRFAPLTFSSLAGVGAVVGAAFNLLIEAGVDPRDIGVVDDTARRVATAPLWVGVGLAGAALLVVAGVGSLLLFAERWSGYRLTREPDGSLRVRHGLLTTRSLSVSHERLRGAQVSEPLLLRAGRGAQTRALSTGLTGRRKRCDRAARCRAPRRTGSPPPPCRPIRPRSPARRWSPTRAPRSAGGSPGPCCRLAALVAAAWLVDERTGLASLLLLPAAAWLAVDRYRGLGHALTARHLVTRLGGLRRRTVALQRDGVIGWTFRQSVFQRRAGVVTAEAVTAAGRGGYACSTSRRATPSRSPTPPPRTCSDRFWPTRVAQVPASGPS